MLKKLCPNMIVESVQETIKFYEENLGFKPGQAMPNEEGMIEWIDLTKDDVVIMLHAKANIEKEWPRLKTDKVRPSLTYYIIVDHIREMYDNLKKKDIEFINELEVSSYGATEFGIVDNNGNILVFSEFENQDVKI